MQLHAYSGQISLNQPWQPTASKDKGLGWIIEQLSNEQSLAPYVQSYPAPVDSRQSQLDWVKAMLTLRPAGHPSERLFSAIDSLLAEHNSQRELCDAGQIKPVCMHAASGTQVAIWQGDITTLKVDAIVNAANSQMQGCFQPFHACIDNAIHSIAGPRLREDCHTIIHLQGEDELTGDAKITRGYNLPSRFVLHTVGPIIHKGMPLTQGDSKALADCYRACLDLAAEQGDIQSIAFCAISTGVFGFPKQEAAAIAVATVNTWLSSYPNIFKQIIFNTFDVPTTQLYHRELNA